MVKETKRKQILFENPRTKESKVIAVPDNPSLHWFKQKFAMCKNLRLFEMSRNKYKEGEFTFAASVAVPDTLNDFILLVRWLIK